MTFNEYRKRILIVEALILYSNFDISGLILLIIIISLFLVQKQVKLPHEKYFMIYLFISFIIICINLFINSSINTKTIDIRFIYYFSFAFYLLQMLNFYFLYLFICNSFAIKNYKKSLFLLSLPAIFAFFALLNNHSTHNIFSIDSNYNFTYGKLYLLLYAHVILYTMNFIIYQFTHKMVITQKYKILSVFSVIFLIGSFIIHFNYPSLQILQFANVLILLIYFILIENPSFEKDLVTEALNFQAFQSYITNTHAKNVRILLIMINNCDLVVTVSNRTFINHLEARTIRDFSRIFKKNIVFRITDNTLAITFNESEKSEQIIEFFNNELRKIKKESIKFSSLFISYAISDSIGVFSSHNSFLNAIKGSMNIIKNNKMEKPLQITTKVAERYERIVEIDKGIINAIDNHLIELNIQPVYDVKEDKIVSGEILSRMNIEKLGYIPSDEFIELAEQKGSIIGFGLVTIQEVCNLFNTIIFPVERISVNISMQHFMDRDLPKNFIEILNKNNISPSRFIVEITETSKVSDWALLKSNMNQLKQMGVLLSLDDFGTGYASYQYLITLPFDCIKIDRTLLLIAESDKNAKESLNSIIKMAKTLGYKTILEGVESENQNKIAKEIGFDYIQGFYYGKPMPLSEFNNHIKEFNTKKERE